MDVLDDKFIEEYSKKILAFAYGKTGNTHDAEDLSQEILVSLFASMPKYSKIENCAIPYWLSDCGVLRYPTNEEAKRLGIIIWDIK